MAAEETWTTVSGGAGLTVSQRSKGRLSGAHAADVSKSIVQTAFEPGGGTAP